MEGRHMLYFGYGAMADPRIMSAVVGRKVEGQKALLPGYHITTQRLDHIPDEARAILEKVWPADFRSYTIMRANRDEVPPIPGRLYELGVLERAIIFSWELISHGWYRDEMVEAVLPENGMCVDAVTEVIGLSQLASGEHVDLSVEELPLLNDFALTIANARRHRKLLAA